MMKKLFTKYLRGALLLLPSLLAADEIGYDYIYCEQDYCNLDVKVYADWILWKERSCDLDYTLPVNSNDDYFGRVEQVTPGRSSGIRVGLEKAACENWQCGLRYTHYNNGSSDTTIDTARGDLSAILVPPEKQYTSNSNIQYASAKQDLSLNVFDIEAGYSPDFCWCGELQFFGGIKIANIDRDFKAHYAENNSDRNGSLAENSVDIIRQKVDLKSCGLYLGVEASMDLYCNLGLFGRSSLGTLVGKVDQRFSHSGQSGGNSFEKDVKLKRDCSRLLSVLDLSVGLYYDLPCFCKSSWAIEVGYDLQHWFNVSNYFSVNENNNANQQWVEHSADGLGFEGPFIRLVGKF